MKFPFKSAKWGKHPYKGVDVKLRPLLHRPRDQSVTSWKPSVIGGKCVSPDTNHPREWKFRFFLFTGCWSLWGFLAVMASLRGLCELDLTHFLTLNALLQSRWMLKGYPVLNCNDVFLSSSIPWASLSDHQMCQWSDFTYSKYPRPATAKLLKELKILYWATGKLYSVYMMHYEHASMPARWWQ